MTNCKNPLNGTLETILRLSQEGLFALLAEKYKKDAIIQEGAYIFVKGEAPVLLVAHLDTVHDEPVKTVCKSGDGNIWMSPEGIGGDDRCGVHALNMVYGHAKIKPWLLFTCDEETGGIGAETFCEDYENKKTKIHKLLTPCPFKLIVEIDRKGKDDAVYYDCDNKELEEYIASKGYHADYGSFSDISLLAPVLGVAAVNLSSGYYNAHTKHEYVNCNELSHTIDTVAKIVEESTGNGFQSYKYIEKEYAYVPSYFKWDRVPWDGFGFAKPYNNDVPSMLTGDQKEKYELLANDYCDKETLDKYVREIGPIAVEQLYEEYMEICRDSF